VVTVVGGSVATGCVTDGWVTDAGVDVVVLVDASSSPPPHPANRPAASPNPTKRPSLERVVTPATLARILYLARRTRVSGIAELAVVPRRVRW
jgi:hypothetical protein